ncbi:MAG: CARDB domain-containing protein, partial [Halobacteriota archaeon]
MNTKVDEEKSSFGKAIVGGIVLAAILAISLFAVLPMAISSTPEQNADIYVNTTGWWRPGAPFNESLDPIQAAINNASDGNAIFVYNGTYLLPGGVILGIAINKPNITLKGEGANVVTLDGNGDDTAIGVGFAGHGGYGATAPGCIVEGFNITNCTCGVGISEIAPNCTIRNNIIKGLPVSISVMAKNSTIRGNIMDGASKYIDFLFEASPVTFMDNVVSNSSKTYASVRFYTVDSVVVNNTFIHNIAGMGLYTNPTNTTVARNNFISSGVGIKLYNAPSGNKIYLNNYINNTKNVEIGGTGTPTNIWNSTEPIEYVWNGTPYTNYLGNYWSPQYTGSDGDGDGIGDTAYDIPGSATDKDFRPLMAGYENYPEAEPPYLVTYTISNRTITPPQTTEIDVEFSETVSYRIAIEKDTATIYDWIGTAKNPAAKVWNGTYEVNGTVVPDGDYTVNVTGTNTTTGLSVVNNTEVITVMTITEQPDLTPAAITTPANIFATESNEITATIANIGTADAEAFNVSLSADGTEVAEVNVTSGLNAGTSTELSFEWTPAAAGTYELCVVADCDAAIVESDETNNVTCKDVEAVVPKATVYFVPED